MPYSEEFIKSFITVNFNNLTRFKPIIQVLVSAMLITIFELKYRYQHRFQIMCIGASLHTTPVYVYMLLCKHMHHHGDQQLL